MDESATSEPATVAKASAHERPTRIAVINTALNAIQAIVIALFGYLLTGKVDEAIKERQANVQERLATADNLEKMADLLTKINADTTDDLARAQATAQLSMYGSDAVFPLFVMAASRNKTPPTEAIAGLRLLAVQRRQDVCAVLLSARKVPKALNEIRKTAIEDLTKDLKCSETP